MKKITIVGGARMKIKDCCEYEQRKICKLWKVCSDAIKGDDELLPCASKAIELAKPSTNSDYAAALRMCSLFRDSGIDVTLERFEQWCFERLHSSTNVA